MHASVFVTTTVHIDKYTVGLWLAVHAWVNLWFPLLKLQILLVLLFFKILSPSLEVRIYIYMNDFYSCTHSCSQ